jgi:hypothetical protein
VAANCTSPPASACVGNMGGAMLTTYSSPGTCGTTGACIYTGTTVLCPNGCAGAHACN